MKKTFKLLILIVLISTFVLSVMITNVSAETTEGTEGGESTESVEGTEEFSLTETTKTIELNCSILLLYENNPIGESVVWTSSDTDVATVNESGMVSAVGIGTAMITATVGDKIASCEITVVYANLTLQSNKDDNATRINLVMKEHPSETLKANVKDGKYDNVVNAKITWRSSNENVAKVDSNGNVTAVSVGTATITAETAGVSKTCDVNVVAEPEFTDFSKAKYELLFDISTNLKISGIKLNSDVKVGYNYIITSNKTKPEIQLTESGNLDTESTKVRSLQINMEENYIYDRFLDEYVELNQELFIWVIQTVVFDVPYHDGENYINYCTKFVVEGHKLTRPVLPKLNLIVKEFDISGNWNSEHTEQNKETSINFYFPSKTENRKFSIKLGRITDNAILKKIQNNDYSGITDLKKYAQNDKGIYTSNLTTTVKYNYGNDEPLFDGNKLLVDDAYYYIYVVFDDENGKYYPIEGVTLGQAYLSDASDYWSLLACTSEKFKWNSLESTYDETTNQTVPEKDETVADKEIPKAGMEKVVTVILMILVLTIVLTYKKCKKYKGI